MKQVITYFYDIETKKIYKDNNAYFFYHNNKIYYLVLYEHDQKNNLLEQLTLYLKNIGIVCHDIIRNKYGSIISVYDEKKYILISPKNDYKKELDVFDMIHINKSITIKENKTIKYLQNWKMLWREKINYYEEQIREYAKKNSIILDSFSYYIGISETALSLLSVYNLEESVRLANITFCHRRVFYPNYKLNFFNPLSIVIDFDIRDYSEYFKSAFFYGENIECEFRTFLKLYKMNNCSYILLFARLLFPTYYFDCYEKVFNNEQQEEELLKIINKRKEYEKFLKFAFNEIKKYYKMPKIDWLL